MDNLFDHLHDVSWQELEKELERCPPNEENIQKMQDFLNVCIEKDIYAKEKMAMMLPFVHNRIVYNTTDWASRLLYEAISNQDEDFIQNLLGYPQVSTYPDGTPKDRIEGWVSYLEHHIYGRYDKTKPCPIIAKMLSQQFGDKDGMGLLRCVQNNNEECFDVVLPFSSIQDENYYVYYEALKSHNPYFAQKLAPLCNKIETLLGLKHQFPYHDPNEKEKIDQAVSLLEEKINLAPTTVAEHLYGFLEASNDEAFSLLFTTNHQDLSQKEIQFLLYTSLPLKRINHALSLLEVLDEIPPSLLTKVAPFESLIPLALQKAPQEAKENLLWVLCRHESQLLFKDENHHRHTVFAVLDSGVDTDNLLKMMESVASSYLLPKYRPQRLQEARSLKDFCALHTKRIIKDALTTPPQASSPFKKM